MTSVDPVVPDIRGPAEARTVRDVALDVLRRHELTTIFTNPGSTEVPFLTDLPGDLRCLLALHEGSVVGIATGWAIARQRPALVVLHTTAGLGNAVGALATARVNRAPLVVLVGQQDRRHLALEPFLAGRLDGLAGKYPVWWHQPVRAQDVPGAIARATHEATTNRGPAVVVVPMDDWSAPADPDTGFAAPAVVRRPTAVDPDEVSDLVTLLDDAVRPAIVVGAGAADDRAWAALTRLAERLRCPVWQEAFGARAGFPQHHPRFAGHLPADRPRLRSTLAGHDLVLAVGAPVFRQYGYAPGPLVAAGTRIVVVTDDPAEAHRGPVDLAVLAYPGVVCERLAEAVAERHHDPGREPGGAAPQPTPDAAAPDAAPDAGTPDAAAPDGAEPMRPAQVLAALAERLPAETVLVEETPSSRPDLHALLPARTPLGFVSAAHGGLGFGLPAAIGLRLALPRRPVVAVVGDGSSLYAIQALFSAAHYGVGALFLVLANGRYAVLDRLAEQYGGKPSWPPFTEVSIAGLARAMGCPVRQVTRYDELLTAYHEVLPTLAERTEPVLLEVAVATDTSFAP